MSDIVITSTPIVIQVNSQPPISIDVPSTGATLVYQSGIGPVGPTGPQGVPGPGVPAGGTTGQRLVKASSTDYDTIWQTQPTAPPAGLDKEIQFNDAGTMQGDGHLRWDKNTNTLIIGVDLDEAFPNNPLVAVGSVDDYLQLVVHNEAEQPSASSDIVATADNGNDDSFYVDMGINSSVYNVAGDATGANDSYLIANGGDLFIIAESVGAGIPFLAGGGDTTDKVLTITANGIEMEPGKSITNRPEILSGTGSTPSPVGLADGTLYIKYS